MIEVEVNIRKLGTELDVIDYDTGAEYSTNIGPTQQVRVQRVYHDGEYSKEPVDTRVLELLFHDNISDEVSKNLCFISEGFGLEGNLKSRDSAYLPSRRDLYSLFLPPDSKIEIIRQS